MRPRCGVGAAGRLAGAVLRDAGPGLWRPAVPLRRGAGGVDLRAVPRVDSAGVAFLAELAARADAPAVEGAPEGLDALRMAYRLSPGLAFSH